MTIRKGFTLIELLVVIAIIGILSTLAIVALGSARQKARDSKRVADLSQVSKALELYYNDNNDYPTIITPGQPLASGSNVYMAAVPSNPTPRNDNGCANADYTYGYITGSYSFGTCVGAATGSLGAGPAWATPQGLNSNRDGLVGFWKFNEGTGTSVADSSGNGNTGTLTGFTFLSSNGWTTSSSCRYGNCLFFNVSGDYVFVPSSSSLSISGSNISYGGWMDFTGTASNNAVLIDKNASYRLWSRSGGITYCNISSGEASFTAPTTGWHHLFCTYNGVAVKLYIDGDLKASGAYSTPIAQNAQVVTIGDRAGINTTFDKYIDNVRVYNITLSDAQVKALYLNDGDN